MELELQFVPLIRPHKMDNRRWMRYEQSRAYKNRHEGIHLLVFVRFHA